MNNLRSDADNCFVCGSRNPIGLQLNFTIDGNDICHSQFIPAENHCGYDGVTHGGIIFSALDDVMANWLFLKGLKAFTAKCEIRYKDVLPIGARTRLEGHCLKQKARLIQMRGILIREDTNKIVAEADASFMLLVVNQENS